jgi:hypothetical protein
MIKVDIKQTVANLMTLHPQFQILDSKDDLVILATVVGNDFSRIIYTVEQKRVGMAIQKVNEQSMFITQYVPLAALDLAAIVVRDVEEVEQAQEAIVSEPTKKSQ